MQNPALPRVREVMSSPVVSLEPHISAREAARVLHERGVTGAPVVDRRGRVLGVVSQSDLVEQEASPRTVGELGGFFSDVADYQELRRLPADASQTPIEKLMTREVVSVEADAPVSRAARRMREHGIHRLLVMEGERLVGVVTAHDLLRVIAEWETA